MSDSTLAQDFYSEFQVMRSDFTARLSAAADSHVSELSAQLVLFRKRLVDASQFIPSYDQRQYEMQLKSWERTLEKLQTSQTSAGAKPKFAFKRKDKLPLGAPEVEAPIPTLTTNTSLASHLSLTSKSECLLTRISLPDSSSIPIDSELIITNLDNCIVDLMDSNSATTNPTAVHIRDVNNCVFLLPVISGSVLLQGLRRCVVVISGCHQFRMHASEQVDVCLPTTVKIIIEGCIGIRFSEYPAKRSVNADGPKNEFHVEDFSHIRQTPSPNWIPQNDKTATLDRWLEKFRDNGKFDLQMLDEILPCVEGSR
ncbi:tubulin binding cofactor C-domain-containing protein [Thelephora terrestris]|uniref:Tubulin binding cofactor C-domain-containing protein n=1 Tax=Thelephora terrestris TaxID=56493 RepID=A0A9P6L392_9AGAM|nr:tubulin binding cofactor C-domain-containing protein [Thelephora terrestris]